jgi:hypothetical protein
VFKSLSERWTSYRHDIATRATNGAVLLDFRRPGWEWWVDPRSLHMADADRCVLGQVYGRYVNGVMKLWPERWHGMDGATLSHSHGFVVARFLGPVCVVENFLLRRAWVAEIDRRCRRPVETAAPDLAPSGVLERCR